MSQTGFDLVLESTQQAKTHLANLSWLGQMYKTPPNIILQLKKKKSAPISASQQISHPGTPCHSSFPSAGWSLNWTQYQSLHLPVQEVSTRCIYLAQQVWIQLTVLRQTCCKSSVSGTKSLAFLRAQCSFNSTHIRMGLHIFSE